MRDFPQTSKKISAKFSYLLAFAKILKTPFVFIPYQKYCLENQSLSSKFQIEEKN